MRIRRTAVAALLAAGIVVPAVSAAAMAAQPAAKAPGAAASAHKATPKPSKTAKTPKPVRFTASGTVTAVDAEAGTVTLLAKGGTKDVRKRTVTVVVPAKASLRVNGKKVTLSGVAAGQRIEVVGRRTGDVYTADVVRVSGRAAKPAPSPSVTPTPTVEPTTEPSDDPTTEPTEDPSDDPTVEPSAEPTA
ncbi:hypothetical protein COUCH_21915 [Couchioplanes caeruleus]|uniref:hypothetical protein n=1 Tax=Couchioplanes caeruleus TaxID=56438 RepID=UPI0020BFB5AB|nr:hypothetical protein [Couchioplanes caeruleus]UQU61699.1 hypothetical protein COUCH_21915 [Couchioplanes caeruleus]